MFFFLKKNDYYYLNRFKFENKTQLSHNRNHYNYNFNDILMKYCIVIIYHILS